MRRWSLNWMTSVGYVSVNVSASHDVPMLTAVRRRNNEGKHSTPAFDDRIAILPCRSSLVIATENCREWCSDGYGRLRYRLSVIQIRSHEQVGS